MLDDYCLIARRLIPTDAHVIRGCLVAAGIPAVVADDQHVQSNLLLAPALGGARVLIPESCLELAHEILAAFERGDLALPEDVDVDEATNPDRE